MSESLIFGDCMSELDSLDNNSIDLVLCDPPYGITACKWDSVLPLNDLWNKLKRITKENSAIVLMSSQPFTTTLISSNIDNFKYEWIWEKSRSTGFLQAKFMPTKSHENICIFCFSGKPTYNPQKTTGHNPTNFSNGYGNSPVFGESKMRNYPGGETTRYPKTVQKIKSERGFHPSQKPVELMNYLIKTYSNIGDTVLDFTMGSGTTGVACKHLSRNFIGIENNRSFFEIAENRIFGELELVI